MTTDSDDPKVLNALVDLLASPDDPSALTDEQLVEAVRQARTARKTAESAAAGELSRRGWSWSQIGKAMGVDPSTAYRWVYPRES